MKNENFSFNGCPSENQTSYGLQIQKDSLVSKFRIMFAHDIVILKKELSTRVSVCTVKTPVLEPIVNKNLLAVRFKLDPTM